MTGLRFGFSTLVCSAGGALLTAACFHAYILRTDPAAAKDGLYPVPFMFLLPIGWVAGATVFGFWALARRKDTIPASGCAIFVVVFISGLVLVPLLFISVVGPLLALLDGLIPHHQVS